MTDLRIRHFLAMAGAIFLIGGIGSFAFVPWGLALGVVSLGVLGIAFAAILTPEV